MKELRHNSLMLVNIKLITAEIHPKIVINRKIREWLRKNSDSRLIPISKMKKKVKDVKKIILKNILWIAIESNRNTIRKAITKIKEQVNRVSISTLALIMRKNQFL